MLLGRGAFMLREEIKSACMAIMSALQTSKIIEAIPRDIPPQLLEKSEQRVSIATSLRTLSNATQQFGENEKKISTLLDLDFISEPTTWVLLLSPNNETKGIEIFWRVRQAVVFAQKFIPLLIKIISTEHQDPKLNEADLAMDQEDAKLVLIVKDATNSSLTAKHVSEIMLAAQSVHDAMSRALGITTQELVVESADSGSNKSFSFKGVAAAIRETRKMLIDYWDRRRLSPDGFNPSKARAIADGLDLVGRIQSLGQNGALSREEQERIKRDILNGLSTLVSNNAVPKEILDKHPPTIRELPVDRPKLIAYEEEKESKPHAASQQSGAAKPSGKPSKKRIRKPRRPQH